MDAERPSTPGCYVAVSDLPVTLSGAGLTVRDVCRVVSGAPVTLDEAAVNAFERRARAADEASRRGPVYGRTTGVGANRDVALSMEQHSTLDLWRSHAGAMGAPLDAGIVRAGLAIRVEQLLAGGSGASAELLTALCALLTGPLGALPVVHRGSDIGTGDLAALAQVGLTLAGERPAADGSVSHLLTPRASDGLPLLSSSAFTLASAAVGASRLRSLASAALPVCALSWSALNGSVAPVGPAAAAVTPFTGARTVAEATFDLLRGGTTGPRHVQDFFGLRTWPQSHGPLLDALDHVTEVVEGHLRTTTENPVYLPARDGRLEVAHHGGFLLTYLTLAVDMTLLALVRSAQSSTSRTSHLLTDASTGLPRFLTDGRPGSSGLLIAEYAAAGALGRLRQSATPASLLTASVSSGVEDDAAFAGLAVARLEPAAIAYREVLAVELVGAVRAMRLLDRMPPGRLGEVLDACAVLPSGLQDRDLGPDFAAAGTVIDSLG